MNITNMQNLIESLPEMETLSALLQNRAKYITREFTIEGMQLQASVIKEDKIQTSNISDTTYSSAMNYEREYKEILKDINNVQKKVSDVKALLSSLRECERYIIEQSIIQKISQETIITHYLERFGNQLGIETMTTRTLRRFKRRILHQLIRRYEK